MQIQKNKQGALELKTKKANIVFDHAVRANDVKLEGAGEYEIGGVSIVGVDDDIYIFQLEELILGFVNFKEKISKEHLEKLSNSEVLIVRFDGNIQGAVEQANQIEPNIVIYAGSPDSEKKLSSSGTTFAKIDNLKITKADIAEQKAYFIETNPVPPNS